MMGVLLSACPQKAAPPQGTRHQGRNEAAYGLSPVRGSTGWHFAAKTETFSREVPTCSN